MNLSSVLLKLQLNTPRTQSASQLGWKPDSKTEPAGYIAHTQHGRMDTQSLLSKVRRSMEPTKSNSSGVGMLAMRNLGLPNCPRESSMIFVSSKWQYTKPDEGLSPSNQVLTCLVETKANNSNAVSAELFHVLEKGQNYVLTKIYVFSMQRFNSQAR